MEAGYKLLENQEFAQAKEFFSEVLQKQPTNKTANICLGRAVGLAGDAPMALEIFLETDKIYPNDFELKLNIGEAYLWNDQASDALEIYKDLIVQDSKNYTANLGSANCHFKLGSYDQALFFIDQAIHIDPDNEGAYNSKKYILLAMADEKKKSMDFIGVEQVLNQILDFRPQDAQAHINLAINYINLDNYKKADLLLRSLLKNEQEPLQVCMLLSHLSMLRHKEADAIAYGSKAMKYAKKMDKESLMMATIQKINALAAAKKFKEAKFLMDQLDLIYEDAIELKFAKARIAVWGKDAKLGLEIYEEIELHNYDYHMGVAEALIALGRNKEAMATLDQALILNPGSLDARSLMSMLKNNQKAAIELSANQSSDVGNNLANELNFKVHLPKQEKHAFHFAGGIRTTENPASQSAANQVQLFVGDSFQVNHRVNLSASLGLISQQSNDVNRNIRTLSSTSLSYQLAKHHALQLGYNRQSLQYSSDLIKSGLIENHFAINYQYTQAKRPALFIQFKNSQLSDGNSSINFFGSAYYEIKSFPVLKLGTNVTHLSFQESKAFQYFSPEKYQMAELFLQFGNVYDNKAKFRYAALVAIGKQKMGQALNETTSRVELELGYRFKGKYLLSVNYFTNTAANSNAKAYSFERLSIGVVAPL